jgi:hypothetical protein
MLHFKLRTSVIGPNSGSRGECNENDIPLMINGKTPHAEPFSCHEAAPEVWTTSNNFKAWTETHAAIGLVGTRLQSLTENPVVVVVDDVD